LKQLKNQSKKLEVKSEQLAQENSGLSKKELLDISREVEKLQRTIGGISEMKGLPSAMFVVDTGMHDIAIQEAQKLGIPVIGIVDTNNDPSGVDYVIPGNDDSARAIKLYASAIADAILAAKNETVTDLAKAVKVEMVEEAAEEAKTVRRVKKADGEGSAE
jgi:small subunit ribosomal protein S2